MDLGLAGQEEQEDGQFLPGLLLTAETPVSFAINSSRYRLREVNRSMLQESCMYLAHSGCRRPDQITHPFSAWCRGLCARSLADRTHQHNITNQNHTVLPCTLLRLKHTPASQHQEDSAQYCTYLILVGGSYGQYPTPFRPANHPLSHALTHWFPPPQRPSRKPGPPGTSAPCTLRTAGGGLSLHCPALSRLASPLHSPAAHLTLLRSTPYGTKYQ